MTRMLLFTACLMGCMPKAGEVEDAPSYTTESGRRSLWRELAAWYVDNHMPDQALQMVQRVRESGETDDELWLIQAKALMAQGTTDEARLILESLSDRRPKDPRPLATLGIAYSDLGDYDRATEVLERAVALDEDDVATRNNLGFLLLGQGRCEDAVPHFEAAVTLDASSARYRNNLGFALVCIGEPQRALKLFRSTMPEADARFNVGIAYERLDKLAPAVLQYRQALVADPDHERTLEAVARIREIDPVLVEENP